MTLTIVVPVHNDREGLQRLTAQVADVDWPIQFIVIDDASDEDCDPRNFGIDWRHPESEVRYTRLDINSGAGACRNVGIEQSTGEHLLFIDADDTLATDLGTVMREIADRKFDFTLFQHHRKESITDPSEGMLQADELQWNRLGIRHKYAHRHTADVKFMPNIAAYPWNKIYRTSFVHENKISCSPTVVHNDIKIHWLSFLLADRILVAQVPLINHYVANGANRLTNRPGRDRFCVLDVFADIENTFDNRPDLVNRYPWYCRFYMGLFSWIIERMTPAEVREFRKQIELHLRTHISHEKFGYVNYVDGDLAQKVLKSINSL